MATVSPPLLVITLNVSGLNFPKDAGWQNEFKKKKQDPTIWCLQKLLILYDEIW